MSDNRIGTLIKKARKEKKISQKDFAEMLDMPATTLSNYENGNRNMSIDVLRKIALKLNLSIDYMLEIWQMDYTEKQFEEYEKSNSDTFEIEEYLKRNKAEIFTINITSNLADLNAKGLEKVDNYVNDLKKIKEYCED